MAREFPLFIIDTDRNHGKGREKDFVACTSKELPWVGEITILNERELDIDQDWQKKNWWCIYTDANSAGLRGKLKVLSAGYIDNSNRGDLQSLMRRCLKEWQKRRKTIKVDMENISDEVVVKFADTMLDQVHETLRVIPDDQQARMVGGILEKLKRDYSNKE